jgi:hypothetical protein
MNRGEGIRHFDKKSVRPRLTCLHVQHEDYKSPMPSAGSTENRVAPRLIQFAESEEPR